MLKLWERIKCLFKEEDTSTRAKRLIRDIKALPGSYIIALDVDRYKGGRITPIKNGKGGASCSE